MNVIDEFGAKLDILGTYVMLQLDQNDVNTAVPGSNASVALLREKILKQACNFYKVKLKVVGSRVNLGIQLKS